MINEMWALGIFPYEPSESNWFGVGLILGLIIVLVLLFYAAQEGGLMKDEW